MEELVIVEKIELRPDGTIGVGGSFEMTKEEAVKVILAKEFKAAGYPIGVMPEGWNEKGWLPVV